MYEGFLFQRLYLEGLVKEYFTDMRQDTAQGFRPWNARTMHRHDPSARLCKQEKHIKKTFLLYKFNIGRHECLP